MPGNRDSSCARLDDVVIWHTRPSAVAHSLADRARRLGGQVISAPVLAIQPLTQDDEHWAALQLILQRLDTYSHIIFVSGNAVRHGLGQIARVWPRWRQTAGCYAIGQTTARLLTEAGIAAQQAAGPRMNSEELVQLPAFQVLNGQRVLIVRGVGGRGWLAQVLTARGASVDYLEAYRREKSDTLPTEVNSHIDTGTIDFITASSGETVENIVKLVDHSLHPQLLGVTIVVPGERVAGIARRCGFTHILLAANAGDDAMIESMVTATNRSVNNNGGKEA
jgi:uroporphyrinogen-III synthase